MNGILPLDLPPALVGILAYVLNVLLMVTVIAAVALIIARSVLRRDACARYLLCLTALLCILLGPLVSGVLSHKHFGLVIFALPVAPAPHFLPVTSVAVFESRTQDSPLPDHSPALRGIYLLMSVWVLGAAYGALRFVWGWRTVARLRRTVHPLEATVLSSALEQVERTLGTTAPPVLTSMRVDGPVALGLLHPVVLLPTGLAETLTPMQLRHVLLHECAHIAFRHVFGGAVQRLVGLLYWPHPLVAALCRELARAREEVCDNVASQEDGAACYARTLLAIAQGLSTAPQSTSVLALLGQGTSLEERITGLLDPRRNRMVGVNRWKLWAVTGGVSLTMALTGAVRVVADDAKTQQEAEQQRVAQAQLEAQQAQLEDALQVIYRQSARVTPRQEAERIVLEADLQQVRQAKQELDRRMSVVLQKPILPPTVQAKQEAERRAAEAAVQEAEEEAEEAEEEAEQRAPEAAVQEAFPSTVVKTNTSVTTSTRSVKPVTSTRIKSGKLNTAVTTSTSTRIKTTTAPGGDKPVTAPHSNTTGTSFGSSTTTTSSEGKQAYQEAVRHDVEAALQEAKLRFLEADLSTSTRIKATPAPGGDKPVPAPHINTTSTSSGSSTTGTASGSSTTSTSTSDNQAFLEAARRALEAALRSRTSQVIVVPQKPILWQLDQVLGLFY